MNRNTNKSRLSRPRGFTLMEILAALVLIGVVLPAVMKGISMAGILASESGRKYEALNLAESKLMEVLLNGDWASGSDTGDFEPDYEGYNWTMETSDWTQADLKQVEVVVFWQERGREREIRLTTLVYEAQ
jgi:prepilin-type N-terminal cleavage/methylation domain-containing protein